MLKLSRYLLPEQDPAAVNFKKMPEALIYDETIVNGLITKEMYYSDESKSDLIIDVDIVYHYGADGLANKMVFTINYLNEDDSIGMSLTKTKLLTSRQKLSLLKKRRKTVREYAEAAVLTFLQETQSHLTVPEILGLGAAFIIKHSVELDYYEKVGSPQVVASIAVSNETWLEDTPTALGGATIRQYLMGALNA